jgi:hypothetical protein
MATGARAISVTATQKWAAGLWAVTIAITIEFIFPVFWWHPSCNLKDVGLGYPGIGFPLPYAQVSGVLPKPYVVMPHVYIVNVLVLSVPIFVALMALLGNIGVVLNRFVLVVGGTAFLLVAVLEGGLAPLAVVPVMSIASKPDGYFSYRPEFMALRGSNRPCVRVLRVREADRRGRQTA